MQPIVRVVPVGPTPRAVTDLYTVECSHELPRVHAKRTLKSVWLSAPTLRKYNALLHRFRVVLSITNVVATCLLCGFAFYPARAGRWIALLTAPLVVAPFTAMFLGMRYDMVLLLVRTYDFWYQTLTSLSCPILFAVCARDARGVGAVAVVALLAIVLLADANYRSARYFFGTSLVVSALCAGNALFVTLGWVDELPALVILNVDGHALTTASVIANGFISNMIIHARNAYVRRYVAASARPTSEGDSSTSDETASSQRRLTTTVRCVLFHSRLRWCSQTVVSRLSVQQRPPKNAFDVNYLQLRCHGLIHVFDPRTVMLRRACSLFRQPSWWCRLLRVGLLGTAIIGYGAIIVTFAAVSMGYEPQRRLVQVSAVLSLTATVPVWFYFVCCVHQLDMLVLLHSSFDFLFIFVQLVLAHLCLCDLCAWDTRALAVMASLLWIHWALTVDAIPPLTRGQLRLPTHTVATGIQVLFLVELALLTTSIAKRQPQRFQDHSTIDVVDWSVGSFFLNRLVTLFPWLGRSIWRLATYELDELVVLRGVVEYDDYEMHKRETASIQSRHQLQQITTALSQHSRRSEESNDLVGALQGTNCE